MKRTIIQDLINWKQSQDRKPLILLGARQVGKTYILKQFGKQEYENVAYINCDNNALVQNLFAEDYNMERIILSIGAITGENIKKNKTLIIFDEIQELPKGLSALKYFCEDAPDYHVAVAGSLLGITLHYGESFPVGKVNILNLYPMNFEEFLLAKGKNQLYNILTEKQWEVIKGLQSQFIQLLREYYFVGGMPEAVLKFTQTNDAVSVRQIQKDILSAYEKDISKHAPKDTVVRINQVWNSIPSQLAKENKKFIYGVIKKGARAKEYELAVQWLIDAGLVYKVNRVRKPTMPLKVYEDIAAFKLYLLDTGLLGAMSDIPAELLLLPNAMKESKGDYTENFISSQLHTVKDIVINYYSKENSTLEIDFVIQKNADIYPIEVKSEANVQSKSLKTLIKDNPNLKGVRASMLDYKEQENITNVPLYALKIYFN
ncbi:MAG: ATP-binding protein [Bacteroidales bacterium]|nr:ATP-binding protein [Bacteroidales bacterium]